MGQRPGSCRSPAPLRSPSAPAGRVPGHLAFRRPCLAMTPKTPTLVAEPRVGRPQGSPTRERGNALGTPDVPSPLTAQQLPSLALRASFHPPTVGLSHEFQKNCLAP